MGAIRAVLCEGSLPQPTRSIPMKATPSAAGAPRWVKAVAVALLAVIASRTVEAQATPTAAKPGFSVLQGFVIDSVHNTPLVNAQVAIEGTNRKGRTTDEGRFRIDSIPA